MGQTISNRQHLPECRPPNLPKSSRPHLPKCSQLQPPKCSQLNQPKCSLPHLPVCSPPCLPNYKHLSESSLPHQPKCNRQHLREGRPPNPPKCSRPNPPKCTRPQLPEGSPPNVTKNSLHHLPPGSLPKHKHLPKGSLSHQPKCNRHHLPVSTPTNLPKRSLPHLPVSSPPHLPHRKHLPKCSIPHQPKCNRQHRPEDTPPTLPMGSRPHPPLSSPPHLPKPSLPDLPVCSPPCLPYHKHLPKSSLPHLPKCNRYHLPEGTSPNLPKCSRTHPPQSSQPQLPKRSPPHLPKPSLPHLPVCSPPCLPHHRHLPKGSLPHQPKCNRQYLPERSPPNMPKRSRPHPPQSIQLQLPKCSPPHLPKSSLAHLPVSSPPSPPYHKHLPKGSLPHQPKSSQPQLPKCSPANLTRRCPLRQPGCSPSHLPNHNQIERRPQQITQCNQPQNAVRKLPNQLMREQDNHDNPKWKLMDNPPNNKPAIKDTEHNSGESPTQLANLESKEKNYKRRRIRKNKELTITTINVRGIKGKIKSLESLLQAEKIDIALITETKMRKGDQISIKGYRWIEKQRTDNKGGGVGILVWEKIANNTTENNNLDDHELLESKWIRIECRPWNIAVGVFYGPQENEKVEKVKEIYNALSHQLHQIQDECDIILAGDFNAKLKISKENCEQAESRNGKILQEMITENYLTPATINADHGIWTRANRKIKNEKSVIDYKMVSPRIMSGINTVIVDEEGHLRIKGKNETDHNTLLMTMIINDTRKPKYIKKWNLGNKEGWKEFNKKVIESENARHIEQGPYAEAEKRIKTLLKQTIGEKQIRTDKVRRTNNNEIKKLRAEKKKPKKTSKKHAKTKTTQRKWKPKTTIWRARRNSEKPLKMKNLEK